MRASMISSSGSENRSKWRGSLGKRLLVTSKPISSVPKKISSAVRYAASLQRCPEGWDGYGAVRSAVQDGSGSVAGLPSSAARGIAFHGRQKSQWYLSFQQLIPASAAVRFCIANKRALSARSTARLGSLSRFRATAFQVATGVLCQKSAMCVCSGVRAVLLTEPSAFTSLKSAAHATLVSAGGPALRNCDELCIRNGRTFPTHGVGSSMGVPSGFKSGCQCPGAAFGTHGDGPKRPSFSRAAIIASAAAFPAAIPWVLNGRSGIAVSEAAYCAASDCNKLALVGNAMVGGTVETMLERTLYAAVATAASFDALAEKRLFSRY